MKRTMKNENCMMPESSSSEDGENGLLSSCSFVQSSEPLRSVVAHMVVMMIFYDLNENF